MQFKKTSLVFFVLFLWLNQIQLMAVEGKQWKCDMFPPEREITTDEVSGAKVVFVTRDKAHDYGFYFHQESWLPDETVLFFRRTTANGMQLFGYIETTGEIFRVQQPGQHLQGEPTASRHANKLWVAYDGVLAEWTVRVKPAQPASSVTIQEKIIGPLPADVTTLSGINENADGKGIILGYTRESSPRSRIVRMDCATGKIAEIMAIDDTIYHIQASWETPDLVLFSRVYLGTDSRAPLGPPDGSYSRLHLVDLSDREPWPIYPQVKGELVTHECWWVNDQITFFSGILKDGHAEEAHMKVLDTRTGVTRILGAGAWWPGGTPQEVSKRNWWHGSGAPGGRFAAADNWHGMIAIFSGKTARTRILTQDHRTYGSGEHPHVSWGPKGTKVNFNSNRRGNSDICIAYLPEAWLQNEW